MSAPGHRTAAPKATALARRLAQGGGAGSLTRAVLEAERLLLSANAHASMLAELGHIELPPSAAADPVEIRALASLYLASTLEAAGLMGAADDFVSLARSGAVPGDLGEAAAKVDALWRSRHDRPTGEERAALFSRLFGAPEGPADAAVPPNLEFESLLLDLAEAIIDAADGGSLGRLRQAGEGLAENVAGAANAMALAMAEDIVAGLGDAVALLNHPNVRTMLGARTMWDAVAAIDRRFRRRPRPTLSHLRRGRAGMAMLAWLADAAEGAFAVRPAAGDSVVDAAVDWVDETLSILRDSEPEPAPQGRAPPGAAPPDEASGWARLAS